MFRFLDHIWQEQKKTLYDFSINEQKVFIHELTHQITVNRWNNLIKTSLLFYEKKYKSSLFRPRKNRDYFEKIKNLVYLDECLSIIHEFVESLTLTQNSKLDRTAVLTRLKFIGHNLLSGRTTWDYYDAYNNTSLTKRKKSYTYNLLKSHDLAVFTILTGKIIKNNNLADVLKGDTINQKVTNLIDILTAILNKNEHELIIDFLKVYDSLLLEIKTLGKESEQELQAEKDKKNRLVQKLKNIFTA